MQNWTYFARMITSRREFGRPYIVFDLDTDRMFMLNVQGYMYMMPNNWTIA